MIETYPALPVMGDVILKAYSLSIPCIDGEGE